MCGQVVWACVWVSCVWASCVTTSCVWTSCVWVSCVCEQVVWGQVVCAQVVCGQVVCEQVLWWQVVFTHLAAWRLHLYRPTRKVPQPSVDRLRHLGPSNSHRLPTNWLTLSCLWFLLLTMARGGWNLDIETRCMQEVVDAGEVRILQQQKRKKWRRGQ